MGDRQPTIERRARRAIALLLVGALSCLASCAALGRAGRRPAPPIPPPSTGARHERVALVADPALQRLLDPYRAPDGPSWLGGDVASSIRLADDRWVWIFGDTLLGELTGDCTRGGASCARDVTGPGAGMIANSAGTMVRGADGTFWPVVKYWRTSDGAPEPIFASPDEGFLWPLAGVRVGAVLLIAANRHTLASGLLPVDNVLVRVWNPDAPPDAWLYDLQRMPGFVGASADAPLVSWTAALVHVGDFVYALGSRDVGLEADAVLGRFSAPDVADPSSHLEPEYLTEGGDGTPYWSTALDPPRLHSLAGLPGTSEATIDFAAGVGWYTFQVPALAYELRLYTADDLLGPWRDEGVVYEIPAPWSTTTRGACPVPPPPDTPPEEVDPDCERVYSAYAAKAHPELAPQGGHAVSYNVNVWTGGLDAAIEAVETLPAFYVPRMLATPDVGGD